MEGGDFIHVSLIEPTERFWGRLVKISEAGVVFRGIDVRQVELFKYQFKHKERTIFPQTLFLPMRRVQKIDLDEAMDSVPSVIQSIQEVTGLEEDDIL